MSLILLSLLMSPSFATDCVDDDGDGYCTTPDTGVSIGDTTPYDCDDDDDARHPAPLHADVEAVMEQLALPVADRDDEMSDDDLLWSLLQLTYLDQPAVVPMTGNIHDLMFEVFDQDLVDAGGEDHRSKDSDQTWQDVYDAWFREQHDMWDFSSMSEENKATFLSYGWVVRSAMESCENSAFQVDDDCSGTSDEDGNNPGVNHSFACEFRISDWLAAQAEVFAEGGTAVVSRGPFTECDDEPVYWIDHSDSMGFPHATLDTCDLADGIEDGCLDYTCVETSLPGWEWMADCDQFRWCADWPDPDLCAWLYETPTAHTASSNTVTVYYRDEDGDTEGAYDHQGYRLCDPGQADIAFTTNRVDCDDTNALVREGADELCDGIDNDCDDEIDDPMWALPDDFDTTEGAWHHIDLDVDGYGDASIDPDDDYTLFICDSYENHGEDAGCMAYEDGAPVTDPFRDHGHLINGDCFVPNDQDCDDVHPLVHPYLPEDVVAATAALQAEVDAGDHGYDGTYAIDLDCDGTDEAFLLPAAPEDTAPPTETGDTDDTGSNEEPTELSCGGCSNTSPAGALWLAPLALIGLRRRGDERA